MKEVIAYVPLSELQHVTKEHAQVFTRMNLAFSVLEEGRAIIRQAEAMEHLTTIRGYNPELKIILSVGGAGAFGFSQMAMTKETRERFLDSLDELIEEYSLDGIDLDWEFPTADWGGDWSPKDKRNYTILLHEMRERLDHLGERLGRKLYLSIAAGVGQWFITTTEVAKYKDALDLILLMTYDLRGFGQQVTGHHTALYQKELDVFGMSADQGVKLLLDEGVEPEKIVIGVAMYSRMWDGVDAEDGGLLQKSNKDSGNHFLTYPKLQHEVIEAEAYDNYWDEEAQVPWSYSPSLKQFVSYDNARSVAAKCDYVLEHDLAGIMFWSYAKWPENPLIEVMDEKLRS